MSDIAIRVNNLAKQYQIGGKQERYKTMRDTLVEAVKAPFRRASQLLRGQAYGAAEMDEEIWALKDVSFEVQRGEALGIIGPNGAGKTTLLKVLTRITEPTRGCVVLHGRVGSLLEVGTGFHPELTGRENIYLNGTILGMTRIEIERKFDEIVVFSGVEKFIDTPVKHYSSGMQVRLAFSVAAHLEPEILLVDEVLAVGDAEFQKRCLGKMRDVSGQGRTVLFVSHNMGAIQALCDRVLYLESGEVRGQGGAIEQINAYLDSYDQGFEQDNMPVELGPNLQLQRIEFSPNPVESGASIDFGLAFRVLHSTRVEELALLIYSALGTRVAIIDLRCSDGTCRMSGTDTFSVDGRISSLPLVEGRYSIGVYVACGVTRGNFLDLAELRVSPRRREKSLAPYSPTVRGVLDLSVFLEM